MVNERDVIGECLAAAASGEVFPDYDEFPTILRTLEDYWRREAVLCEKATLPAELSGTGLAEVWSRVGMPKQSWWLFAFEAPRAADEPVPYGTAGTWKLLFHPGDGSCYADEHFANSTFVAFARMLVLWDAAYRRIERESPGDSGEDFDHGDLIVGEMKQAMRAVDPAAFERDSYFWPQMIWEMAE